MKRKLFAISFLTVLVGTVFGLGVLVGQGALSPSATLPPSAIMDLFWETHDELKTRFYRPENLAEDTLLYGAISGMVEASGDPYTAFFPPDEARRFLEDVSGHFEGIGTEIGFRNQALTVIAPLPDSPAKRAGLQPGDAILKIDDASTASMSLEEAVSLIRGPAGSVVTITIFREGNDEPSEYAITRARIDVPILSIERRSDGLTVIELVNFAEDAPTRFRAEASALAAEAPRGIILDLRNNAGGFLDAAIDIAGWFLNPDTPAVIERQRNQEDIVFRTDGPATLVDIPIVVLINGGTASAAEILAGALAEERGVPLIGEKSFGKGTIQEFPQLSGGAYLKVTVGEWLTPMGVSITEKGLSPTIEVKDDPETISDEVLERAAEYLSHER